MRKLFVSVLAVVTLGLGACTPQEAINVIFTGSDNATAHRVAYCESRYNPNAVSRTNDHGVMQINIMWNKPGHHDQVADWIGRHWHMRYDPVYNTLMAKMIRQKYGWGMWACY